MCEQWKDSDTHIKWKKMQKHIWIDLVHICICLNMLPFSQCHAYHIALMACWHSWGYRSSMIVDSLLFHVKYLISYIYHGIVLIPKHKLMPRSISMPRSQPMSSYPLYSSLVFCHSQAPISVATKCLAQPEISINPPSSAEMLIITHKPCIISEDGNKVATFYPLALCTLATRSQVYWKDCSPSTVSI